MADMTPENFIQKIKAMSQQQKNHLKKAEIMELIMNAPDQTGPVDIKFSEMTVAIDLIKKQCMSNAADVVQLKSIKDELNKENVELRADLNKAITRMVKAEQNLEVHEAHLNEIDQYLRINNIELVGHPNVGRNENFEDMLVRVINTLPDHSGLMLIV